MVLCWSSSLSPSQREEPRKFFTHMLRHESTWICFNTSPNTQLHSRLGFRLEQRLRWARERTFQYASEEVLSACWKAAVSCVHSGQCRREPQMGDETVKVETSEDWSPLWSGKIPFPTGKTRRRKLALACLHVDLGSWDLYLGVFWYSLALTPYK